MDIKSGVLAYNHDAINNVNDNNITGYSDALMMACYLRTLQLVNTSASQPPDQNTWWEEWQHFADQFYSFVDYGLAM